MTTKDFLNFVTRIYNDGFKDALNEPDDSKAAAKFAVVITQTSAFTVGTLARMASGSEQDKEGFMQEVISRFNSLVYKAFQSEEP